MNMLLGRTKKSGLKRYDLNLNDGYVSEDDDGDNVVTKYGASWSGQLPVEEDSENEFRDYDCNIRCANSSQVQSSTRHIWPKNMVLDREAGRENFSGYLNDI